MKFVLTILLYLLMFSAFADDCDYPAMEPILKPSHHKMVESVNGAIKEDFKRRVTIPNGAVLALSIESNFSVPLIGNDNYFGRIYMKAGENHIKYRDELIANKKYSQELKNPDRPYFSSYAVSDINGPKGLSLVNGAGAVVNLRSSGSFNTTRGGRVYLKVKAPGESSANYTIDVNVVNGRVQTFLISDGKKIPFDNIKINADKNFLGSTTIMAGIKNIQFTYKGKLTAVKTQ